MKTERTCDTCNPLANGQRARCFACDGKRLWMAVACCERCKWWVGDEDWIQAVDKAFAVHTCRSPRFLQSRNLTDRCGATLVDSDNTVFDASLVTGPDFACAFFEEAG